MVVFCTQTLEVYTCLHVCSINQGIPTSALETGRTVVRCARMSCSFLPVWDGNIS